MTPHKGLSRVDTDPAMIRAAVVAVLTLAGGLGLTWATDVDTETVSAVVLLAGFLIPLVQGLWTRYAVTANAKVVTRVTTDGAVVAGDAAERPTGLPVAVMTDGAAPVVEPVAVRPELLAD